jgi:hypothetical protein
VPGTCAGEFRLLLAVGKLAGMIAVWRSPSFKEAQPPSVPASGMCIRSHRGTRLPQCTFCPTAVRHWSHRLSCMFACIVLTWPAALLMPSITGAGRAVAVATGGSMAVTGCAWVPGTSLLLSCASGGQVQAWELSPSGEALNPAPPPLPLSKAVCGGAALGLAVSGNGAFVAVVRAGSIAQVESNKCVCTQRTGPRHCHLEVCTSRS